MLQSHIHQAPYEFFYLRRISMISGNRGNRRENVAVGKTASQSSYVDTSISANNAVDDNTTQLSCILTATNQSYTWWEVDLGEQYFIHEVVIHFRTGWTWRRNGIQVYTSISPQQSNNGQPCGEQISGNMDGSGIPDVPTRTCNVMGRYVTLYQATYNRGTCGDYNCDGTTAMDFCEVLVMACTPNVKYGANCDMNCIQRKCASSSASCDVQTGNCGNGGCRPGYQGLDCTQACASGVKYGSNCIKPCDDRHCAPSGSYRSTCPAATGKCYWGCDPGWKEDDCTQACESGVKYGSNCMKSCDARHCAPSGSDKSTCPAATGKCEWGCTPGWKGDDCTQGTNLLSG
ncbi:multiple epidermal growth factor-like domains protein 10 [Gigantopelta aegis]|uniref:multiple epidermal growth factor-like domains protein 10 n=1 Tax=Gigantopelta aegis TaxID=1735272 RepID=UPI001B888183|nr:multiple epidermal growth factor-like domains protein 10 [Gigantopelta aegis]